jgi:serine/threonine protein kinase
MEEIGEGAYGIVFKGVNNSAYSSESKIPPNRKLPTVVAVKVVQMANLSGGSESKRAILAKLRKECNVLIKFDKHPNIVKYYGFLEDKEKSEASIFMEFIPAGTLQSMYRSYGPLDELLVKRVTR